VKICEADPGRGFIGAVIPALGVSGLTIAQFRLNTKTTEFSENRRLIKKHV
jgi:hypothetical protein